MVLKCWQLCAVVTVMSVFTCAIVGYARQQRHKFTAPPVPEPAAIQTQSRLQAKISDEDLAAIASRLDNSVKKGIADELSSVRNEITERAKDAQERADRLQSWVGFVATGWLAVVTVVFLVILFFGWQEGRSIRATKEEAANLLQEARAARIGTAQSAEVARESAVQASASAERIRTLDGEVSKASERISAADRAVASSVEKTVADMPGLIEIFRNLLEKGLTAETPRLPPFDVMSQFEQADILIVVADNNSSIDKKRLAEPFTALGYYWRLVSNYPRAIARFRRALEIDATLLSALSGVCAELFTTLLHKRTGPS
jgi:hypothetical protein